MLRFPTIHLKVMWHRPTVKAVQVEVRIRGTLRDLDPLNKASFKRARSTVDHINPELPIIRNIP